MSGVVLYTPGHSLYTDTLMVYGLAYALKDAPGLKVKGLGTHYIVEVDAGLGDVIQLVQDAFEPDISQRSYLGRLLAEKDYLNAYQYVRDSAKFKEYLKKLMKPGHVFEEGKLTRKGGVFKLPLIPMAGKYLHVDLTEKTKYDTKQYVACQGCIALAILGLIKGAIILPFAREKLVVLFAFEGRVDSEYFNNYYEFFESEYRKYESEAESAEEESERSLLRELGLSMDSMPSRTLVYTMVSLMSRELIVGMDSAEARWRALVVRFNTARAVQVRGYQDIELDSLIATLAEIIKISEAKGTGIWDRLREVTLSLLRRARVKSPIAHHAVDSLDALFEFLIGRNLENLYDFARSGYKAFDKKFYASGICEALFSLAY